MTCGRVLESNFVFRAAVTCESCRFSLFYFRFGSFVFCILFLGASNAPINNNRRRCKYKQKNSLFYCCAFKFDTIHAISTHLRAPTTTYSHFHFGHGPCIVCMSFRAFPSRSRFVLFFFWVLHKFSALSFGLLWPGFPPGLFSLFPPATASLCVLPCLSVSVRSSPLCCEHFSALIKIGKQNRIKFPDRQQIRVKTLRKLRSENSFRGPVWLGKWSVIPDESGAPITLSPSLLGVKCSSGAITG